MKKLIMIVGLMYMSVQLTAMQDNLVDISGLDKTILLQALFDRAKPQGLGFRYYDPSHILSIKDAHIILTQNKGYADYVKGRVMKVDVSGDTLDTWLFNRDNGNNTAEDVIEKLRQAQK